MLLFYGWVKNFMSLSIHLKHTNTHTHTKINRLKK
uniref:Uncharacterized protein n=1 Tax=Rhizophora mucronata TaxID=61149 RepID=A0A2P2QI35_RHIMU